MNYYQQSLLFLDKIKKHKEKPTILLHTCCAICLYYPLIFLKDYFNIVIFYSNSNIDTEDEFNKRLEMIDRLIGEIKENNDINISLVVDPYKHEEYMKDLIPYKDEKEGLNRCRLCYFKRLNYSFLYAKEHNIRYVTTTMTSSRQKNSSTFNEIGLMLQDRYNDITYFLSDFKKNAGGEIGVKYAKEEGYYIQHYCGCEYSSRK